MVLAVKVAVLVEVEAAEVAVEEIELIKKW